MQMLPCQVEGWVEVFRHHVNLFQGHHHDRRMVVAVDILVGIPRGTCHDRASQLHQVLDMATVMATHHSSHPFHQSHHFMVEQPWYLVDLASLIYSSLLDFSLLHHKSSYGGTTCLSSSDTLDWTSTASSALGPGTSVAQISVAIEVPNRDDPNSILSVLNRLSQTASTDSRRGVQKLSSEIALELLRRRSSIVSASSSYKHYNDRNKALREFQSKSVQERSKFENENTSRYGGLDRSSTDSSKATMAVVTLVIAIDGDSTKLPRINSLGDVEEALRKIASDAKVDDCLAGCRNFMDTRKPC